MFVHVTNAFHARSIVVPSHLRYAVRKQSSLWKNTASNDGKEGGESERHLTPPLLASRLNSVKANGVERSKALSRVLSQHWDHRDTPRNFWSQFFGRTEPLHMSGTTWLKSLRSPQ
ncbi:unnamed protein product [Toxocara canis]|uniref:ACAS_N domain-containing protein n=1 Tax=Toxocara canis TaxID=6265 RepID=A0A183UXF4_TOXCA|nr:unnamed protein product [Toxocara canis]